MILVAKNGLTSVFRVYNLKGGATPILYVYGVQLSLVVGTCCMWGLEHVGSLHVILHLL